MKSIENRKDELFSCVCVINQYFFDPSIVVIVVLVVTATVFRLTIESSSQKFITKSILSCVLKDMKVL
jgi:hypothetical protein